ncbi:hypothetical protein F4824DRAFT_477940 [Ustulina deusta]|nr:hypothetical protein F4824DRAFT_477940 [Ustulina deusta]
MVTRALYGSVLALWFLADYGLGETTTAASSTPTNSALVSTSTFVSPSSNRGSGRGLSDRQKVGLSIGVTLAAIIIAGSIAIFCVIRRRNRTLMKPETRAPGSRDIDDQNMAVGGESGTGKEVYYMNATSTGHNDALQQAPYGFAYQGGGYPTIPDQMYAHQQMQGMLYPTAQYGGTCVHPGTAYPGIMAVDASQQHGYSGPSITQYQPEAYLQPQQHHHHQQQQGGDISWIYPVSAMSPVEQAPAQDFQYKYLQDYQHQVQSSSSGHYQSQDGNPTSIQGYQEDTYHVPPPHPHASELPDQREPAELMGEGHYKEVP